MASTSTRGAEMFATETRERTDARKNRVARFRSSRRGRKSRRSVTNWNVTKMLKYRQSAGWAFAFPR